MNEIELAWAAGFFDGEGSTYAHPRGYLQISISQTDEKVLERFLSAVGMGRVTGPYHYRPKPSWRYTTEREKAVRVLELLWPYLCHVKKEQAEVAKKKINQALIA